MRPVLLGRSIKNTARRNGALRRKTATKMASPAPAAVIAGKQRRASDEPSDIAATDAVAARVAAVVIARRVTPTGVTVTVAVVIVVIPRRGRGGDCGRE